MENLGLRLGLTYFNILSKDVVLNIFYGILDLNDFETWKDFISHDRNIEFYLNDNIIAKRYIISRYPDWYNIIKSETLELDNPQLKQLCKENLGIDYHIKSWYLTYTVIVDINTNELVKYLIKSPREVFSDFGNINFIIEDLEKYFNYYPYALDIIGRYIFRKYFSIMYNKLSYIDMNKLHYTDKLRNTWLDLLKYFLFLIDEDLEPVIKNYIINGQLPHNYIVPSKFMFPEYAFPYENFLYYVLFKDPSFNPNIQDTRIISRALYRSYILSMELYHDILKLLNKDTINRITQIIISDLLEDDPVNSIYDPVTKNYAAMILHEANIL